MGSVTYLPDDARVVRGPLLWWQRRGLSYTRTGYGKKIPSEYMVEWGSRRYRVYFMCYSNAGSAYVVSRGHTYFIQDWRFSDARLEQVG